MSPRAAPVGAPAQPSPRRRRVGYVPLHLVTGPANSGKAGRLLGEYRARIEQEPILVVPAFRDVEWSQRELARSGAVLGAHVVRFAWLFELIAERCGGATPRSRRVSPLRRALLIEEAVRP